MLEKEAVLKFHFRFQPEISCNLILISFYRETDNIFYFKEIDKTGKKILKGAIKKVSELHEASPETILTI